MTEHPPGNSIAQALKNCATEPVQIPGITQPCGCLIGFDPHTQCVLYASANSAEFVDYAPAELFGRPLRDLFSRNIIHALRNAPSQSTFGKQRVPMGRFALKSIDAELSVFRSDAHHVLEIEPALDPDHSDADALSILQFLIQQIQSAEDQSSLFDLTVDLLQKMTGYDRVLIYKFDQQFNGEVLAEKCPKAMVPYLGLRFPHWDIPAQARKIMTKLPLRFIQDVDQEPVPLWAADVELPPLDIAIAVTCGASSAHLQYLRNMGAQATLILSVVVDGALWGMISFHHRKPKIPAPQLRTILLSFLDLFTVKLQALQKDERLRLVTKVDQIKDRLLKRVDENETMETALPVVGPLINEIVNAVGVAIMDSSGAATFGQVPEPAVLRELLARAQANIGVTMTYDNLGKVFPDFADQMNECAGALAVAINPHRALCVFRAATPQSIRWAGNPNKTIETVSGQTRLTPRESFSTYLQEVEECCALWTDQDINFCERIWTIVDSAERQALRNKLNRQQKLIINELNHRVRNILALVGSVSRQTQRRHGSLSSYAKSLETGIQALAAAHNVASGSGIAAADLRNLIEVELGPYNVEGRINILGPQRYLPAEIAPIVSLVIHELATNAAKYGSLSIPDGTLSVSVEDKDDGIKIDWRERGGPKVAQPTARGFGCALIQQAVPHELGGKAELKFLEDGVEASIFLPPHILETLPTRTGIPPTIIPTADTQDQSHFAGGKIKGAVLLLEDNFIIAKDMSDQLEEFGFETVDTFGNAINALEFLETERPVFGVLDVNLGAGKTSEQVAKRLAELGITFVFVTGYGDTADLSPDLAHVLRLTKPVSTSALQKAIRRLFPTNVP